jgi:hypothetical protein
LLPGKAHCVVGIFAAFASPGTTSGTPTERVAKGDNALMLVNASGVPDAIRTHKLQTATLLRVRIRKAEMSAA